MADVSPWIYLNGQYVPRNEGSLDVEDRGVLFADGVYEVVRFFGGKPLAMQAHVQRMVQSLEAIQISAPPDVSRLDEISRELVRRNNLANATAYWQVTRGASPRNALFPSDVRPTVLVITHPAPPLETASDPPTATAILADDLRWHRCDIKSLMLLPNVLAKNHAAQAGADEAILHRSGTVTEGTATSVAIVRDGHLWTHPTDHWILDGITRRIVFDLAIRSGSNVVMREFHVDDLLTADEVILCGTTKLVTAVLRVEDRLIGTGQIGPVARRLHEAMVRHITTQCGLG